MKTTLYISILFLSLSSSAQLTEKIDMMEQVVISENLPHHQTYSKENVRKKFGATPLSLAFRFYKKFISSQDNNSCSFHPSCSVYAMESIHLNGLIRGSLRAIDRLSRCHGMAPEYYTLHEETRKLNDPVLPD